MEIRAPTEPPYPKASSAILPFWSDEIHKWNHLKHLRYSIVLGSVAERKKALEADADIYIINRENLQWLIEQSGVNFFWDMVVLDELSSLLSWKRE